MTSSLLNKEPVRQVTIGIPAFNEEANIPSLLRSLESQYASGFVISEVLISDDSSDGTPDKIREFASDTSLNIKLMHHANRRGAAAAWNEMFETATGDAIVLYDADTIPHPLCTAELVSGIDREKSVALCASNPQPVHVCGTAGRAAMFISNWLRGVRKARMSQYTVMGRALAIDTKITKGIKIPSETIAIDLYLQCKVLEQGLGIVYNDDAIVYFRPPGNMIDLASQVVRAMNGHRQIQNFIHDFKIALPLKVAFLHTLRNTFADPIGAASVVLSYSLLPYYKSSLTAVDSARWHTAQSSKSIDYQKLKFLF